MSQRRKENASPNQTGALKGSSSFSTHRSGAGIPAPFPLIHECAHAGAGKRAGKNFFTKKKAAAPFLLLWARGAHNRWQESHPCAGSEAVHSSMPLAFPAFRRDVAPAQGGRSPPRDTAPPSPLPELPAPSRGAGLWGASGWQILSGYRISALSLLRISLTGRMCSAERRLGPGHCFCVLVVVCLGVRKEHRRAWSRPWCWAVHLHVP